MKRTILILLAFIALTSVSAQTSLNDYKYVIVPKHYDFANKPDEYMLNSLTKFLFEKYNFDALMEGETFPSDYGKNNCLALKADVLKESTIFKTKLTVQLKNCQDQIIFTSTQGESREKKYNVAHNQALRNAFKSIEAANYKYNPDNALVNNTVEEVGEQQDEIVKLKEEIKVLKEAKAKETITEKPELIEKPLVENAKFKAEAIDGGFMGYNLVNSNNDKVYTIFFSGKEDLYIVKNRDAVIYKLNNKWVIAEAKGKDLQVKSIDIKF
ncbi:hypothetical protein CLV86_2354 [Lacinutrix venerupis]|uniref:hypothetical protein n=1 Tax=Lacinutrix venerupis TaxID=1486034 RepID=UPI000EACB7D5|nr:hypothetical protein [Lacinutrix venerupis]RLJ61961.1 hypothetical protein CLV86_2354 [Lacinutrix venerupis]